MNEFQNRNYMSMESMPHGVFFLYKYKQGKKLKFYFVRITRPDLNHVTTIAKCKTREEAEAIYKKHMGDEKEVPYYEITNIKKKGESK